MMPFARAISLLGGRFGRQVMFLCTIFYKYVSLTELPDIHDRMSRELKVDYELSGLTLSATFITCVVGAIAFSALLLVAQIAKERGFLDRLYRDATTGLLNKTAFKEALDEAQAKMKALPSKSDTWYLFLSMDIQGFKAVNDKINHVVGDTALHEWGKLVESVVAKVVKHCKAVIYRVGGDEIAIICEKEGGVSDDQFCEDALNLTKELAEQEYWAEGSNSEGEPMKMPTFLRCV